jgi:peptidoglycan/xylan/chitin deacetylase (PgdA/CDA1 family)
MDGKKLFVCVVYCLIMLWRDDPAVAGVVTKLPSKEEVVAITFDACETKTPSFFDNDIIDYLVREEIPFTIFVSGKFARRNSEQLTQLSRKSFIEIENHSLRHRQHMEKLSEDNVRKEVVECETIITELTGRKPIFFRFPAGNYDQRTLKIVEALGYQVVHWTFPSGDPDKQTTPERLSRWVLGKVQKGDILIFHINGRGYGTGEALPRIVEQLREKGYRFTRLDAMLSSPTAGAR